MKIDVYPWYDAERNAVILRWAFTDRRLRARDLAR
jgi:hypothetical protein